MSVRPYLFFTNTAREAMTRYQEILGGQLDILSFDQLPEGEHPPFDAPEDMVMHAALTLDDGDLLLASDDPTGDGSGVSGVAINIALAEKAEARRIFGALAEGGQVGMELAETFFSPLFGTCVDRFGVTWMVMVEAPDQADQGER